MSRSLTLLISTLLTLTGCSNSESPSHSEKGKQTEAEQQVVRTKINEFQKKTKADASWIRSIDRASNNLFQPIYAVDLENVWLIDKPILFTGRLNNVSTETESDYALSVESSDVLSPKIRLDISCEKSKVASVITEIKSDVKSIQPSGIVLAASITKIKSVTENLDEDTETVFYGQGKCIDIAYIGDAIDFATNPESQVPPPPPPEE